MEAYGQGHVALEGKASAVPKQHPCSFNESWHGDAWLQQAEYEEEAMKRIPSQAKVQAY